MAGPSYTTVSGLVSAIAADAGTDSAQRSQAAFTAIGSIERGRREGPSRVVWEPQDAKWEPAVQDEAETSRSCYQRVLRFFVWFLATDFDAADQLVSDFGAAVFRTQSQWSVRVIAEEHNPQSVSESSRYEIRLTVEVDKPVLYQTFDTEIAENASQSGDIVEDLS